MVLQQNTLTCNNHATTNDTTHAQMCVCACGEPTVRHLHAHVATRFHVAIYIPGLLQNATAAFAVRERWGDLKRYNDGIGLKTTDFAVVENTEHVQPAWSGNNGESTIKSAQNSY